MEYKKKDNKYILRLDKGEEIIESLMNFCKKQDIKCGSIIGLGACNYIKVGYFDVHEKEYFSKEFEGNFEVAPLYANISTMNDEIYLHAHITFGDENFNSHTGHLNKGIISATFEVEIEEKDMLVDREHSNEIGLNLYKFN